jgi:hypothetical protein
MVNQTLGKVGQVMVVQPGQHAPLPLMNIGAATPVAEGAAK